MIEENEGKVNDSEEKAEIKTSPLPTPAAKHSRPCPTVSQSQLIFKNDRDITKRLIFSKRGIIVQEIFSELPALQVWVCLFIVNKLSKFK